MKAKNIFSGAIQTGKPVPVVASVRQWSKTANGYRVWSDGKCDYCGHVEVAPTKGEIDRAENIPYYLQCPSCGREGCEECMPCGRGCLCPECEDQGVERVD